MKKKQRQQQKARKYLMRRLKNWKIAYGDSVIQKLLKHYNLKTAQDLYYLIAIEKIELLDIKDNLLREETVVTEQSASLTPDKPLKEQVESQYSDYLVIEDKVEGLDYKMSKCCNPVFGDSIFGFVTISEGIKIHRTGCPNAHNMMARYPYRVVAAKWRKSQNSPSFIAAIKITGVDDVGMVNKIADVITGQNAVIRSFNYNMDDGIFEGVLNIMVSNNNVLHGVIRKIQSIKGILKASRQDSV